MTDDRGSGIPAEAVEAAARAMLDYDTFGGWDSAKPHQRESYSGDAGRALAAAVPVLLEAAAAELEKAAPWADGMYTAADLVRRLAVDWTEGNAPE